MASIVPHGNGGSGAAFVMWIVSMYSYDDPSEVCQMRMYDMLWTNAFCSSAGRHSCSLSYWSEVIDMFYPAAVLAQA